MRFVKTGVITLTILLFVGLAAASQAELTIFPEESSTEVNSFTSYEVEVENVGPVDDVYTLTHSHPGEISIAPTRVEVPAGQSKTVNVWFNPRTDRDAGTYSFNINARSRADGQEYSTSADVNVITDHDVSIETLDSQSVCRGEEARYDVEVTNDGLQSEEFALEAEFGELATDRVSLEPGETTTVTLTASSEDEQTETFNVKASSTTSYAQDVQTVEFTAETCYQSEVSITPESQDVMAFNPALFEVTVDNQGTRTDQFTISTSQGQIQDTSLEIEPGATESTALQVIPSELGTKQIEVGAEGLSTASDTAQLQVDNPMDSQIELTGPQSVCEEGEEEFEVLVENTGEADEVFELETKEGEFEDSELEIGEGSSETTVMMIDGTQMDRGEHQIDVTATASTFGEPQTSDSIEVNVENCWNLEMNVVPEIASAGENRSTIYEIKLENTGTRENTYDLDYEGPEWIEIGPSSVTVAPGETGRSYMYAGVPFQKRGEVKITAEAEGTGVTKSETVTLVIDRDIEEAILSREGEGITARFSDSASRIHASVLESTNFQRGIAAIIAGMLLTLLILYREW